MGRTGGDESPGTLFTGTGYRQPRDVRQTVLVCGVCRTDCGNVWDERKQCVRKTDASAQKAEKETGEGGCSVMRKSEKLSDAIGEISDDIIEEAYTYKPKHDMHQRKASFKWGAAVAVLAMLVLAGSRCVRRGRNFLFPAWNNCFQIYGEGCKGGLPYPGNSGNTAGNSGQEWHCVWKTEKR